MKIGKKVRQKYRERVKNRETICITLTCIPRMIRDSQDNWRGWMYDGWSDKELRDLYELLYMSGGHRWKDKEVF